MNHKSKKRRSKNMKIQQDGKEYTLTAEEVMEAHEEFVTSFIKVRKNERGERNMKFDINALIQKQKRPIKDKKQLSAELKKTIEQEEDPRIQKHKINALKKGYTPEEAEKIASICRSYYKSIDKMQAELSEKSMKIHEIFNEQSVKKGSWQQKYLTDFDKYVSKCRYCLNSGLDLPDEPLFTDYVPDLIPVEEELNQESAAAGMTLEEYIEKEYLFK